MTDYTNEVETLTADYDRFIATPLTDAAYAEVCEDELRRVTERMRELTMNTFEEAKFVIQANMMLFFVKPTPITAILSSYIRLLHSFPMEAMAFEELRKLQEVVYETILRVDRFDAKKR